MSYHGLILDFGGVVTSDFYGALASFCRDQGLDDDAFVRVLRDTAEGRAAIKAVEKGQITQRDYERIVGQLLGVDGEDLLARALVGLTPRPEVMGLVRRVRAANIPVAVLSNSWGVDEHDPYARYGLEKDFDAVVISGRVGLRKPDPAIYELTAAEIGVAPSECVFVDDTEPNLPSARALGMATVHFDDPARALGEVERLLGVGGSS